MLSWELPPAYVGGVGMVCAEICRELSKYDNLEIEYAMPYGPANFLPFSSNCNVIGVQHQKMDFKNINFAKIPSLLSCYETPDEYLSKYHKFLTEGVDLREGVYKTPKELYGKNIMQEVELYAQRVANMYKDKHFDVVHAHDWTTMKAALLLKELTGVKVIYHVHITEYDKTGNQGGHPEIIEIEKEGIQKADKVVAISQYIRNQLLEKYEADDSKIEVVYNAKIGDLVKTLTKTKLFENKKTVLFMGRMTMQKGPEYFLYCAKKILEYRQDVIFVVAGGGDQLKRMIELSCDLGISDNVFFHGGAYNRDDANKYFGSADVFVMPSVSEPFGVVPYEAMVKGTPVVISRQSGISEILNNAFKVNFWDTDEMAHRVLGLLDYPALHDSMTINGFNEVDSHTWEGPVKKLTNIYSNLAKFK